METLEITPLENRSLTVILVEKEYNEPFWLTDPPSQKLRPLSRPSVAFLSFLENLIKKTKIDFATGERGMRSTKSFFNDNGLAKLFERMKIPFYPADLDDNARAYLGLQIDEKKLLRDRTLEALEKMSKESKTTAPSLEEDYLVAYGQCLQSELEAQEHEIGFPVRESWIVMNILNKARELNGTDEVIALHISSPEHVEGVKKLLESLDATVETLKLSKEILSTHQKTSSSKEMEDFLQSMQIRVKPIIKTASEHFPYLLFFLDTDKIASSFDVCMAYDAGFNAVLPYQNVTSDDAKKIVQDAIFSRGPKGAAHTCFFIGGRDAVKAEEISKVAKNAMFPPFEASIIIDPGGAYTTAAATIAKVEERLESHNLGSLNSKVCAVFGTGTVGRIISVLLSKLGCDVTIAALNPTRVEGDEYAAKVAQEVRDNYGANVRGVFAPTPEKKVELLEKAEVIFCAGIEGLQVIDQKMLQKLKLLKVIADINAIPPLGVEGIKLNDDMREIIPGIIGIGALTIGKLKHKIEREMLKKIQTNGKTIYNYNSALELARKLLKRKLLLTKLAVTLSYPRHPKTSKRS